MRESLFRDNFWSSDLTSTVGYDSIIQHLNDGRKNCKEFEDFLKERAIIEEKYGKELINLSKKKPCGQTELKLVNEQCTVGLPFANEHVGLHQVPTSRRLTEASDSTLKRSLDVFKQQIDKEGQGHIQLAQTLREEARKMEDFREKQKLHRKKIELIMDAIHKNRNLQYKKTMEAKRLYEQRCRDKDEAEQAVHRNANLVTQKQQEKTGITSRALPHWRRSEKNGRKSTSMLVRVITDYKRICTLVIKCYLSRKCVKACETEFFETQEWERINYFRNALWLHVNQLSQDCVQNDEKYEEIRKSLEMCSIEKDIDFFVNLRKTGSLAPAPVVYENYYNTQRNPTPVRSPVPVPISSYSFLTIGFDPMFAKQASGGGDLYPPRPACQAEDTVGLGSVAEVVFPVIPSHTELKGFSVLRKYLRTLIIIHIFRKCLLKSCAFDQQTPWTDIPSSHSVEEKEHKRWTQAQAGTSHSPDN
ncbi:hypothetical protein Q9233_013451 [Columba guinea]|nr:hypothetical protein Q9233_013451 [Columba guinea]